MVAARAAPFCGRGIGLGDESAGRQGGGCGLGFGRPLQRGRLRLTGGAQVAVYDAATRREEARIAAGKHSFGIAASFDGTRAYVDYA